VTSEVLVPARALTVRAVRASGPGGQNVNKVASKVDLRVNLDAIEGLSDAARERLRMLAGRRLDAQGHLVVVSQATRDQFRNLEVARERVRELVSAALREPRPRRPTHPSAAAGETRLTGKKRRAAVKRWRARPGRED
jgi:ribosome-associated protein